MQHPLLPAIRACLAVPVLVAAATAQWTVTGTDWDGDTYSTTFVAPVGYQGLSFGFHPGGPTCSWAMEVDDWPDPFLVTVGPGGRLARTLGLPRHRPDRLGDRHRRRLRSGVRWRDRGGQHEPGVRSGVLQPQCGRVRGVLPDRLRGLRLGLQGPIQAEVLHPHRRQQRCHALRGAGLDRRAGHLDGERTGTSGGPSRGAPSDGCGKHGGGGRAQQGRPLDRAGAAFERTKRTDGDLRAQADDGGEVRTHKCESHRANHRRCDGGCRWLDSVALPGRLQGERASCTTRWRAS